jgi:hypothetical protein
VRRPTVRARIAVSALLVAAALGALLGQDRARARHLAVPAWRDASLPHAAAIAPGALPACGGEELVRVGGRVAALLVDSGGALWIGTFDRGVTLRDASGALRAVPELAGRARFVNALAEHGGLVWAATQGGLVALRGTARVRTALAGEGVTALTRAGGALYAGTARGVFRVGAGEAEALGITGPDGEPLRVTALAASGARLWIGTPSGAYSVALGAPAGATARWQPLVFGDPGAETNVVTALAPFPGGAVAGTDDGGLVRLLDDGGVAAVRLADPRANEVNPGAAAALGDAVLAGTQGGGLLVAGARGATLEVARPADLAAVSVSAIAVADGAVLLGTDAGAVLRLRCAPELGAFHARAAAASEGPTPVARGIPRGRGFAALFGDPARPF